MAKLKLSYDLNCNDRKYGNIISNLDNKPSIFDGGFFHAELGTFSKDVDEEKL